MIDRRRLSRRVTKGARLLDEKRPGWADEIDVESLDLSNDCQCVLGQLHGYFTTGVLRLWPERYIDACSAAAGHGFNGDYGQAKREEDALLTAAWKRRIATRVT